MLTDGPKLTRRQTQGHLVCGATQREQQLRKQRAQETAASITRELAGIPRPKIYQPASMPSRIPAPKPQSTAGVQPKRTGWIALRSLGFGLWLWSLGLYDDRKSHHVTLIAVYTPERSKRAAPCRSDRQRRRNEVRKANILMTGRCD